MKCDDCNNKVRDYMNYCPFCGKDLTLKKRKNTIFRIVIVLVVLLSVITYMVIRQSMINDLNGNNNGNKTIEDHLPNMVESICNGAYNNIYLSDELEHQGIYECARDNYVYYVMDTQNNCGLYPCGNIYELGYVKHEDVEAIFPNAIYLYRDSRVLGIPDELKIAVTATSEKELIEKYAEPLYQYIKNLNKEYKTYLRLNVYYNDSLSGINSTYDKLFLMAGFYTNNATQSRGMGRGYGQYIFYDGDPTDLLSTIFAVPTSYPTNARNALKFKRSLMLEINDGRSLSFEDFKNRLQNSFQEAF